MALSPSLLNFLPGRLKKVPHFNLSLRSQRRRPSQPRSWTDRTNIIYQICAQKSFITPGVQRHGPGLVGRPGWLHLIKKNIFSPKYLDFYFKNHHDVTFPSPPKTLSKTSFMAWKSPRSRRRTCTLTTSLKNTREKKIIFHHRSSSSFLDK